MLFHAFQLTHLGRLGLAQAAPFLALSEESGRATSFEPHVVSSGNPTPFGKGGRSVELEVMAAANMTFLVEMVVERSVD